jgi:hypothetical protein
MGEPCVLELLDTPTEQSAANMNVPLQEVSVDGLGNAAFIAVEVEAGRVSDRYAYLLSRKVSVLVVPSAPPSRTSEPTDPFG